ncbi:MAG: hypothetical protein PHF25_09255, partial [Candidatus Margulisbacteria bacterium]|nr:hypothetical protein [Candidatus Margulisiibacteriota bacterium]
PKNYKTTVNAGVLGELEAPKTFKEVAGTGLETIAAGLGGAGGKVASTAGKSLFKRALTGPGAKIGAAYGAGEELKENKSLVDVAKGAVIGAGTGALFDVALLKGGQGLKKLGEKIQKPTTKTVQQAKEEIAGKIIEGKTKDQPLGVKALESIDTKGVKTFKDLETKLTNKITELSKNIDKKLDKDTSVQKLKDIVTKAKSISGKEVKTNYVETALKHLQEVYRKTGDNVGVQNIKDTIKKATTTGLTKKEINNIARSYGVEFGKKAFSKGEPLTSVNSKLYETVRKGLKEKARETASGLGTKEMDKTMSAIYKTRDLIRKNKEEVNKLQQKIQERGLGEKLGRSTFNLLNLGTGGWLKGFIERGMARGTGLKTLNYIELEKNIAKNLKLLEKANKSKTKIQLEKVLNEIAKKVGVGVSKTGEVISKIPGIAEEAPRKSVQSLMDAARTKMPIGMTIKDVSKEGFSKAEVPQKLTEEARKYKSAEEFMKAQGKTYYRATEDGKTLGTGERWAWTDKKTAESWAKRNNAKVVEFTVSDEGIDPIDLSRIKSKTGTDRFKFDTSKAQTKSQIIDIWKQANQATPEQSLIQEAKKYKTAEEFVNAQFRETDLPELKDISNKKKYAKELGFNVDKDTLEVVDEFWAKDSTPNQYYHVGTEEIMNFDKSKSRFNPELRGGGISQINGMYLGRDPKALSNFYGMIIKDDFGENPIVSSFKMAPKWLDLSNKADETKFLNEVSKKYNVRKGRTAEFGDALEKEIIARGYDGARYFDPYATGEEFVLVKNPPVKSQLTDIWNKANEGIKETPYKETGSLTTKLLKKLEGRTTVNKQFVSDLTNSPDLKQTEKDLIRAALKGEDSKINVTKFADKVKAELLPLKPETSKGGEPRYEQVTLPEEIRGNVAEYYETVYNSPIKTSAGQVHFGDEGSQNYFGHTRIEDMADNKTRRVIEVQSDLYQKGRLESEIRNAEGYDDLLKRGIVKKKLDQANRKQIRKLEQYNDPTAHFRMVREEISQAAKDKKTKLLFPTGETAMKIEGLETKNNWIDDTIAKNGADVLKPEQLKVFQVVRRGNREDKWVITDVLGDGKFKAVPFEFYKELELGIKK